MKNKTILIALSFFFIFLALQAEGRSLEDDRSNAPTAASRSWLPGAMVEVEAVEPVIKKNRDDKPEMVDLVVEIKKVHTGPASLQDQQILINPNMAFRFPPDRWCAYGMGGIHGESSEFYPPGRKALLWIFQRKELQTNRGGNGQEFSFVTGFTPLWDRSGELTDSNAEYYREAWNNTRSMMQVLKTLEGIDDRERGAAILKLVEHKNPKVRKWALAALVRVHGVKVIPLLKSLNPGEEITAEFKELINQYGSRLTWDMFSERKRERIQGISLLGVEVLTEEKSEGRQTLYSKPKVIEPGTVKVLRVFSGNDHQVGEVLPFSGGQVKPGEMFVISPRQGKITIEVPNIIRPWTFPPKGRWNGGSKVTSLMHQSLQPEIDLEPLEPWFKKLSSQSPPYADDFLDEALRNAPLPVATWALWTYPKYLRSETLDWLRQESGLTDSMSSSKSSLRNMFLCDWAMLFSYRKLWQRDIERITLLENIMAHPLADQEEAWLLYSVNAEELSPYSAGTPEDWRRLATAARNNSSWKEGWLDPHLKRGFDFMAWNFSWTESRAWFDASIGVNYLVERWAIPDRGEPATPHFLDSGGQTLDSSLPLKLEEVEKLRSALAARLAGSGEKLTPDEIEKRVNEIRSMTWEEILNQRFP